MTSTVIGYAFVKEKLGLSAFDPAIPARIGSVDRVQLTSEALLIPAKVAPKDSNVLTHVLFALKHEGTNLSLLSQALRKIPAEDMVTAIKKSPSGGYIRIACFLWETFNQQALDNVPPISGSIYNVFDPKKYITCAGKRNPKWRVNFNGLGSLDYCVVVERTPHIESILALNILQSANEFLSHIGPSASDRTISWAYFSETQSSFEIEREIPSPPKAEAFVALLKKAHLTAELSEEYLVSLQNTAITNPFDQATQYRYQQNWLSGPLRGAAGVTYIPPAPELAHPLMDGLIDFSNHTAKQIDPLVAAAIISFGFVFIHPFMDGNGRLSRFLFHQTLSQAQQLKNGMLLPVSIAMKRNEDGYLAALKSFSAPARKRWDVLWIDGDQYQMTYQSDDAIYRFWDATTCVEFGLEMAKQALEDLKEETDYLAKYDRIYRVINSQFDIRGNDLNILILACMDQNGKLSLNRRKKYSLTVQPEVFDAIEKEWEKLHVSPQMGNGN